MSLKLIPTDPFRSFQVYVTDECDIPLLNYQVVELFIRKAMNSFGDKFTTFPDDEILKMNDPLLILNYLSNFKNEYKFDWGFHPLKPSGWSNEAESIICDVEALFEQILNRMETSTKFGRVQDLQFNLESCLKGTKDGIAKDLQKLKMIQNESLLWRDQQTLYLKASKMFSNYFFKNELSSINDFIHKKQQVYFESSDCTKDALRNRLNTYTHRDFESHIQKSVEDAKVFELINEIRNSFRKKSA